MRWSLLPHELKEMTLLGEASGGSMTVSLEQLGTPGAITFLHLVPETSDDQVFRDNTERPFEVSARLSKVPAMITEHIQFDFGNQDGGSYLKTDGREMRFETPHGPIAVEKNEANEISLVKIQCTARNPVEARHKFVEAASPTLDHLSYTLNVAVFIALVRVFDVTHKSRHLQYVAPYRAYVIMDSFVRTFVELKPVYSMYREAKNADSQFYKFLCYYKIMEGLLKPMRKGVIVRAKEMRVALQHEREIVPDDAGLADDLKVHVGKSIKAFFDNFLTANFRNAVAHFVSDVGTLDVSSARHQDAYGNLAFISDLCARALITEHERLLAQLYPARAADLPAAPR
jgi:hypothetical protein